METSTVQILNNEGEQRFEAQVGELTAFLNYRRFPDRLVLVHTEVPPQLRGKGIAAKLVATALDFARDSRLRVIPLCPYVVALMRRHPEYAGLLSAEDRAKVKRVEPQTENPNTARDDALRAMAFYEIARRGHLTGHPDLEKSPAFQRAKEIYQARAEYLWEAFGKQEAIDDYFKLHLEGALARQGKTWQDAWAEFAPESLKKFPLAPGDL